jgi:hypothetical protein
MSYTIKFPSGGTLAIVPDDSIDTNRSVTFIGKDYKGYGFFQNQNFATLLANSASPNYSKPSNPITGQLWYDTTNKKLCIYEPTFDTNEGWASVGSATTGYDRPTGISVGDFWYDLSTNTLNLYAGSGNYLTLTSYPREFPNGWIKPPNPVLDNTLPQGVEQQVTLLQNYGSIVGALSNSSFTASSNDSENTFSLADSAAYPIVRGLNIIGYLQATDGLILNSAPPSAGSPGVPGQIAFDSGFIYVCTSENVWKRSALTSF